MPNDAQAIESQLYLALEALEENDLVTARQYTARANWDICELWKARRKSAKDE